MAAYDGRDDDRFYFRQLLSGRDFAVADPLATQMVNFSYLIGDRESGEALIVDPAYGVGELLDIAAADGMTVVRRAGHPPPRRPRRRVDDGLPDRGTGRAARPRSRCRSTPTARRRRSSAGSPASTPATWSPTTAATGSRVGAVEVELLHTPGHTPGSQCFLVDGMLVAGDTLFLEGCGRTDLPGSDPEAMYESLQRLASLPDTTVRLSRATATRCLDRHPGGGQGDQHGLQAAEQSGLDVDLRGLTGSPPGRQA